MERRAGRTNKKFRGESEETRDEVKLIRKENRRLEHKEHPRNFGSLFVGRYI